MYASVLQEPRPLERRDDRSRFQSGVPEIDDWFHRFAWQNHSAGNARVFVTTQGPETLGFYALSMGAVQRSKLPDALKPSQRPEPCPILLLARLAVDQRAQGRGIGAALLTDALLRTYRLSNDVGFSALLVYCAHDRAREFYLNQSSNFVPCPGAENHLVLPLRALREFIDAL
ncbi:GNAT family N-acetyltransferase [uncultured Actinomyces sp.]|uniref:GNAT family N-acetyltransferase n=1 Tax=uncultured Actinomyces sp. TaxID=249061 RepID=UPI0028D6C264|nr:GNAT family N-acetyltransferase [uncultured Actinomyces sp.]